jgi:hypothetical protein
MHWPSKPATWVRFPSPALAAKGKKIDAATFVYANSIIDADFSPCRRSKKKTFKCFRIDAVKDFQACEKSSSKNKLPYKKFFDSCSRRNLSRYLAQGNLNRHDFSFPMPTKNKSRVTDRSKTKANTHPAKVTEAILAQ